MADLAKGLRGCPLILDIKEEIAQFQKISIHPQQKRLEFPGGGGLCKAKTCKEVYKA